jgi:hypothetical protein
MPPILNARRQSRKDTSSDRRAFATKRVPRIFLARVLFSQWQID